VTTKGAHSLVHLETFDEVIGCVYGSALDPSRWLQTTGMVADLCRSHYGALSIIDLERNRYERAANHTILIGLLPPAQRKLRIPRSCVCNDALVTRHEKAGMSFNKSMIS